MSGDVRGKFPALSGVHTGDRIIDEAQGRIESIERVLNANPFVRGKLFSGLVFAAGVAQTLTHKFGVRAGWILVGGNSDGTGNVFRLTEAGTAFQIDPPNQISMYCDQNATLDIWLWPKGDQ